MIRALIGKGCLLGLFLVIQAGIYAQGQSNCSARNLRGSFGFSITGKIINTGVDCAINGRFATDPQGKISGTLTESAGGHVMRTPFNGAYTVNPDCTGSINFKFPNGLAVGSAFVMSGYGDKMYFMNSDDASTVPVSVVDAGTIRKQYRWAGHALDKCSAASFQGKFALVLSGTKVASSTLFVTSGLLVADGKGQIAGSATESIAGHVSKGPLKGNYKIRPDCTGTGTIETPAHATQAFDFVVVGDGDEVFLIGTDDGIQQTGTATKQRREGPMIEK